jgi:hypothetical protein
MSQPGFAPPAGLSRVQSRALALGVLGCGVSAALGWGDPSQFFPSYLLAFVYWLGIALGALALLMLQHLTGGAWGVMIRRPLEAATRTLPLMALLFVPLAFGLQRLYPWTDTAKVLADPVLRGKMAYLNVTFFFVRAAICFAIWLGLAMLLNRWSRGQDETGDPALADRMRKLSGAGLLLWGVTITVAAIDWLMSLEPHWFSTIFGILIMGGFGLGAMAFAIIVLRSLSTREPLAGLVKASHFHDLGNLLLAFVVLWAYFSFSQLLIIWSGNLPEEIPWYLHRIGGGWTAIAGVVAVFYFAVPFVMLLSRRTKRRGPALALVAGGILAARLVDLFYLIAPEFSKGGFAFHALDAAAVIGVGGLWTAFFCRQLGNRPLLPVNDPELAAAIAREQG